MLRKSNSGITLSANTSFDGTFYHFEVEDKIFIFNTELQACVSYAKVYDFANNGYAVVEKDEFFGLIALMKVEDFRKMQTARKIIAKGADVVLVELLPTKFYDVIVQEDHAEIYLSESRHTTLKLTPASPIKEEYTNIDELIADCNLCD